MTPHSASAVLTSNGRYALQLRDGHVRAFPGCWGLFGGGLESGETPYQAIVREVREELELNVMHARGLVVLGGCVVFGADVTDQWNRHVLHEGSAVRLFTVDELLTMDLNLVTGYALGVAIARLREPGN